MIDAKTGNLSEYKVPERLVCERMREGEKNRMIEGGRGGGGRRRGEGMREMSGKRRQGRRRRKRRRRISETIAGSWFLWVGNSCLL